MNADLSTEDVIRRGLAAARLLTDDTLTAVLAQIEAECAAAWAGSNPADVATREDAYRMTRCVVLLRQKLEAWRGAAHVEQNNVAWRLKEARGG